MQNGATLLNPKSFKNLRLEDVRKIFIGLNSKEIPLLNERLQCLHEIGEVLEQKYDGKENIGILQYNFCVMFK